MDLAVEGVFKRVILTSKKKFNKIIVNRTDKAKCSLACEKTDRPQAATKTA